jgi:hypothetical protein
MVDWRDRAEFASRLFIVPDKNERRIKAGDSGSPVVNNYGLLVGVISNGTNDGTMPIVHRALPQWLINQVLSAQ